MAQFAFLRLSMGTEASYVSTVLHALLHQLREAHGVTRVVTTVSEAVLQTSARGDWPQLCRDGHVQLECNMGVTRWSVRRNQTGADTPHPPAAPIGELTWKRRSIVLCTESRWYVGGEFQRTKPRERAPIAGLSAARDLRPSSISRRGQRKVRSSTSIGKGYLPAPSRLSSQYLWARAKIATRPIGQFVRAVTRGPNRSRGEGELKCQERTFDAGSAHDRKRPS
jgi:hypothetical protein